MSHTFYLIPSSDHASLVEISEASPHSPFNSPEYADALLARNAEPCGLALVHGGRIVSGCIAAVVGKRWNRRLNIYSAPHLDVPEPFWSGVFSMCRDRDIDHLNIQSFASKAPSFPGSKYRVSSRARSEFVIDLCREDFRDLYGRSHKQRLKKAIKRGFTISNTCEFADYETHVAMMQASTTRRLRRGESVPTPSIKDFDFALLTCGLGELVQVSLDGTVLSSMLLLRSPTSGYYHSSGTSSEGMRLDASRFLIDHVASKLAEEGRHSFNLGGVDPDADGLRSFKSGFGAQEIELSAELHSPLSPIARLLWRAARGITGIPGYLSDVTR